MSRPNLNSALLVLLLLSAATSALPAARSSSRNGDGDKNTPQRLELPQSDEQPLYMRLDDVLERPGTDPTVVVVSQGRIIRGGDSSNDNKNNNTPNALARILSAPLQLVRDVFRGGDRDQDQDRHEEATAAAAAAVELRRRVDDRGELGGREHHHDHQHHRRHPLPHPPVRDGSGATTTTRRLLERRGKIHLYGYRYPDPEVEGEGKGMKGAQGGVVAGTRWQD
ncbi:hypothetical protein QBC33DRAFT_190489 [Phialemonium atrogriseum]|uniref:Uncharacterized protein n=1 Tax=Phialemonium atrogriseum TaxID=1093897 RepID=A0AAJ0BYU3_9PEZI|nr:uncharacterized protein QBC33DRAFT_190489 [Phialemonium atrogriseum]KAK1764601.1 hypothetical protein QBC33DRAFT_190489 [Phialemonium atrogriseum]